MEKSTAYREREIRIAVIDRKVADFLEESRELLRLNAEERRDTMDPFKMLKKRIESNRIMAEKIIC